MMFFGGARREWVKDVDVTNSDNLRGDYGGCERRTEGFSSAAVPGGRAKGFLNDRFGHDIAG